MRTLERTLSDQAYLIEQIRLAVIDGDQVALDRNLNPLYDETVADLIVHLGEDTIVRRIDPLLSSTFSDMYKEDVGFRPRNFSYERACRWMDNNQ